MKSLIVVLLVVSFSVMGQQSDPKEAFLEKWEHSASYLLEIVETMPSEFFDFKPTERQMSFQEQLLHIKQNMDWLGTTYFSDKRFQLPKANSEKGTVLTPSKERLKNELITSFDLVAQRIRATSNENLSETVEFFAGPMSKLQILNLLQDHVTHHRGQLIVYLNLKDVEPPRYSGW